MSSVNVAEWSKAIDTEIDELQQLKMCEGVNISLNCFVINIDLIDDLMYIYVTILIKNNSNIVTTINQFN